MKKLIMIVAVGLTVLACKQEKPLAEGRYRINGTITGLENGAIYLINQPIDIDTIEVNDGAFVIERDIEDSVKRIHLSKINSNRPNQGEFVSIFVEPTEMTLNIDYENFSEAKLSGSKTQDDQYRLQAILDKISEDYKEEKNHANAVRKKYNDASKAGASDEELEAIKYEDDEAGEKLAPMWEKQGEATLQFIKDNPKSYVSFHSFLYQISNLKYAEAKAILDQLDPEYLKTDLGKTISQEVENLQKGIPGAKAANFETVDIRGDSLKLADFKGKYLLIDFWASWCVPCRKGNPHLISLYNKYHPKGLEILGVSDDDQAPEKWRKAVEKDGIDIWHHVLRGLEYKEGTYQRINQDKDISDAYNIHSLPTKILVDPNGVIIGRYGGGGSTDEHMDKDLAAIFESE